jgi:hypothetical protein
MANRQSQSSPGRSIGPKLVGHQQSGRKAVLLEQFAHEPRGCPVVAPPLHQQIKNFTLVVDRSPEPELSAADQHRHLVQVPLRGRSMTSAAKFPGEQRAELQHLSSDRLVGEVQPALGEQILDIAEAQGEAKVQPHRVSDDVRGELVASE